MSSNDNPITSNTYKVVEAPARASRRTVGQVASVGRSPASIHVILTADAARSLASLIGGAAIIAGTRPAAGNGFDPQLWAGIALDLEATAELGDLDAVTTPADIATPPPLLRYEPRHRDDGEISKVLGWTRTPNGYQPRHAKTTDEIRAGR